MTQVLKNICKSKSWKLVNPALLCIVMQCESHTYGLSPIKKTINLNECSGRECLLLLDFEIHLIQIPEELPVYDRIYLPE